MLYILSVATEIKFYMPYLIESVKKHGSELIILGKNEKWQGYNWRFKLIYDFILNLQPDDVVCVIDCWDVLCVKNLSLLESKFNEIKEREKCKIIVGHDKVINFFNSIAVGLKYGYCKNRSINAGTYIGTVKDLSEILLEIYNLNPNDDADDQILLTKYCNLKEKDVYIDVKSEIFITIAYNLNEIDHLLEFKNNQIYYNGSNPFFLHAPGSGFLDNIIKKLGYNYNSDDIKNNLVKNFQNRMFKDWELNKNENINYVKILITNCVMNDELILILILLIIFLIIMFYKNLS